MSRWVDRAMAWVVALAALLSSLVILGILAILATNGIKALSKVGPGEFFLGTIWRPEAYGQPHYGTLPLLLSSVMATAGALAIAVPWGFLAAAFLSEVASPRLRAALKPVVELLAGVPSVIYGLIGIALVGPIISKVFGIPSGLNALNASVILAIMVLPTIVSITDDALRAVPDSYREAARGLGATRWQTIWRVVFPAARSGVVAAVMLGFGRAIGETMAVLMVAGNAPAMPKGFLDPIRTMTATIAIELGEVPWGTDHYYALFALGLYLFLITLGVNLLAEPFVRRVRD